MLAHTTGIAASAVREELPEGVGLRGVRVLDLGRYIAAPYCGALLADQGAEVIRIEHPAGAPDRDVMPIGLEGRGALYLQVNRNKKSLALDIAAPDGRKAFERLVATADVVIVNLPPAALRRAGLDYETLVTLKPDIILTTVAAFGAEGPDSDRVGFDGTGQALSGAMMLTGSGEMPMRAAVSYVDFTAALSAAFATMSALYERSRTGRGQHVRTALLGAALMMTNPMLIEEAAGARRRGAIGNRSPIAGPSDLFRTSDGWVMVQVIGDVMFARWARLIGRDDLISDPRFSSDIMRGENGAELSAIMEKWCAGRTSEDCLTEMEAVRIPGCRALTPAEALHAREAAEGGFFRFDDVGIKDGGVPIVTGGIITAASLAAKPVVAPLLGADSSELLVALGYDTEEVDRLTGAFPE